jgi:hypothetical protein
MKKPLPTDLQILDAIYERYYDAFASEAFGVGTQQREILIPIDIPAIAKELRVDPDVVFGRLYYHFDHKFRYRRPEPPPDGSVVVFFTTKREIDRPGDFVNFPYMASVLAELRAEHKRHRTNLWVSVLALVIAIGAIAVSILTEWPW